MSNDAAELIAGTAVGMIAEHPQAGGGSIGAKETDVSEQGHAVCSRDDQGPTEPATPPAKSPPKTEREFERAMRELGFSKRQAREIAARGFKGASHEAPADEDTSEELAALLKRNLQLLERQLS